MFFISFFRILKFAYQDFWRNIWLSLVTISIIILTLFSINLLIVLNLVTDAAINSTQERLDLGLYFKPEVTEEKILEAKGFLEGLNNISSIQYISKEEGLETVTDDELVNTAITELGFNPLGGTLKVKADNLEDYKQIWQSFSQSSFAELLDEKPKDIEMTQAAINQIDLISQRIKQGGLGLSIIFTIITILIVFNTIRMAIYTHREEIAIMKLVGASNRFIRSPYLLESILYGFIACLLTFAFLYLALHLIEPFFTNFFAGAELDLIGYFNNNFFRIFGLEFLAITSLNILSSGLAIRKYLRV